MPWRGRDALYCTICHGHRDDVGPLSARYKCESCREERKQQNNEQLQARRGPYYRKWRSRMITSGAEWSVEAGEITEEEAERLLDFHLRSGGKLPKIATARQRHVAAELNKHYRKAPGNPTPPQSQFLVAMNIYMQYGIPRLEAEERIVKSLRGTFPDFSPLRR
jgi:hypothetical protein